MKDSNTRAKKPFMETTSPYARKITATLFSAQSLGSAGFILNGTIAAIVGAKLSGNPALAGVPSAILQIGTALASFGVGIAMDWVGRRRGLAAGFFTGVFGAAIAAWAIVVQVFPLFLLGSALIGVARAAMNLGRFTAAEVHPPLNRGRAISYVVLGGTVGSVLGPLIAAPSGTVSVQAGLDELAGPYLAAGILFLMASLALSTWLRPDPIDIGREIASRYPERKLLNGLTRSIPQIIRATPVVVAVTAMVFGQMIMVMLMGLTSLHMSNNNHALGSISLVFSSHTVGMFAFSILTGRLTDNWGREQVIIVGAGLLILSSALAPLSTAVIPLAIALFLLGLGWNFCYVGGSALLADQLSPAERSKTQGFNDLLIGMVTAMGSFGSGLVFATMGYGAMGIIGIFFSFFPLLMTGWWMIQKNKLALVG